MTSGYSGTPLPAKLGIKPGSRLLVSGAPPGFLDRTLVPLPDGVTTHTRPGPSAYDVVVTFAPDGATLRKRFVPLAARITTSGGLWVCWPKKASGVSTDLSDNSVRAYGLAQGLVDVKVCAVDETWSGMKFVVRLKDRG